MEIQFYLLAPAIGLLYELRSRTLRYAILIILMTVAGFCNLNYSELAWYRTSVFFFIQYFLVGFLLADLYVDLWKMPERKTLLWDSASLIGWTLVCLLVYQSRKGVLGVDQTSPLVLIGILLAYTGALRGRLSSAALSFGAVPVIGGMCYTIYLYHYTVIVAVSHIVSFLMRGHSFLTLAIVKIALSLPLVGVVSIVMFVFVERPCMDRNWPQKLRRYLARRVSSGRAIASEEA
jgi:peptidoglycan/LPS O-acetylase OafA/YrhL